MGDPPALRALRRKLLLLLLIDRTRLPEDLRRVDGASGMLLELTSSMRPLPIPALARRLPFMLRLLLLPEEVREEELRP